MKIVLNERQRQCLAMIAQGDGHRLVFPRHVPESLARLGFVERTSMGWRITWAGLNWIEAQSKEASKS